MTKTPLLQVSNLTAGYHGTTVLHGVSLDVGEGEYVTVLGANGAGKTTLMQSLMGLVPARGSMRLRAHEVLSTDPHKRVSLGIGFVPEGRRVFPALTVEENLRAVSRKAASRSVEDGLDDVFTMFPRLRERRSQLAGTLSGGEQQMLALGRALISQPKLLLADEISLGLAPMVVEQMFEVFRELNAGGMSILLAEQNAHLALESAHTAYVMETGRITLHGKASELAEDPRVIESYLQVI